MPPIFCIISDSAGFWREVTISLFGSTNTVRYCKGSLYHKLYSLVPKVLGVQKPLVIGKVRHSGVCSSKIHLYFFLRVPYDLG